MKRFAVKKIFPLLLLSLIFFSGKAEAYNGKSITISRSKDVDVSDTAFNFYRPHANINLYQITGLSISAVHSVEMVRGNYAVNTGDDIDFSYNPGLIYNADGYYFDTPYGIWSNQLPSCSLAKKYEIANNFSSSYYILAIAPYYDRTLYEIGTVCYDPNSYLRTNHLLYEGDLSMLDREIEFTSKNFSPSAISVIAQKPTVSIKSSDESVISCSGLNCAAKKDGTARLTAVVDSFSTKIFINIDTCDMDEFGVVKKTGRTCSKELTVSPDLSQGTADQLYWDVRVGNKPPTAPILSGPTTGSVNIPYSFSMTSTDPDGDKITYGVDDDNDGAVEAWVGGYVVSGTTTNNPLRWYTNGVKTFRALAKDVNGLTSDWSYYSINIGNQPPTAPVITGETTGIINTPYIFNVVSNDLDGDGIKYFVAWDGECAMREILPNTKNYSACSGEFPYIWDSTSNNYPQYYAKSGVAQTTSNQWSTTGVKTLHVQARDMNYGTSAESTFTINIGASFSCSGDNPGNATLCTDDDQGLNANTPKTLASSCGTTKCEYICNDGYSLVGGSCIVVTQPTLITSSGNCGEADGTTSCKIISKSELCVSGNSYSNLELSNDGKWTWKCSGKNGENPVNCSAMKDCSWREVNP